MYEFCCICSVIIASPLPVYPLTLFFTHPLFLFCIIFTLYFFQIPCWIYFSFFHFIIDKKQLDIEVAHLVAASVEVKDVTEEGNGNENDGNLK